MYLYQNLYLKSCIQTWRVSHFKMLGYIENISYSWTYLNRFFKKVLTWSDFPSKNSVSIIFTSWISNFKSLIVENFLLNNYSIITMNVYSVYMLSWFFIGLIKKLYIYIYNWFYLVKAYFCRFLCVQKLSKQWNPTDPFTLNAVKWNIYGYINTYSKLVLRTIRDLLKIN